MHSTPQPVLQKWQETHQPEFIQRAEMLRLRDISIAKKQAEKAAQRLLREAVSSDSVSDRESLDGNKPKEHMRPPAKLAPIVGRGKSKKGRVHVTESSNYKGDSYESEYRFIQDTVSLGMINTPNQMS
ncbi:hypothetical protein PoB_002697400 [Plakobranchus ocellatus]|uniref:Uncharacterized protein n=1 Tax=Plakobranchus ocellatus TaxID=259542 RepID=A0AAV3ZYQ1_9GAST|nr:hypothetical protein PoB_002697400 [Plakobranchus ocellatus]